MSILEAIEEANINAKAKGLSFANLQEFSSFQDSFTFLEYPRNVVVPFSIQGTFFDNRIKDIVQLQGWMITRIAEDTNDYRSVKLEVDYISPMRVLAKKFLIHLLSSDLTDPEVPNVTYQIVPEYAFLASHLFGVSYRMNWPINSRLCT